MSATVVVVRHPDSSNDFVTEGDVDVINIDLGGSFDMSHPCRDGAWAAFEQVDYLRKLAEGMPEGPCRSEVVSTAGSIEDAFAEWEALRAEGFEA